MEVRGTPTARMIDSTFIEPESCQWLLGTLSRGMVRNSLCHVLERGNILGQVEPMRPGHLSRKSTLSSNMSLNRGLGCVVLLFSRRGCRGKASTASMETEDDEDPLDFREFKAWKAVQCCSASAGDTKVLLICYTESFKTLSKTE